MKQMLIKILKTIAVDVRQAAVPAILLVLVGGSAGILLLSQKALDFAKQTANMPTPLWVTIALVALCCGYIYLKQRKNIQSSDAPDYKINYFTIGNYKWETKIYKDGFFEVEKYPLCIKHDLRFIFGNHEKHCPAPNCNNRISEYDEFKIYESAKSIIENKVRNKDY